MNKIIRKTEERSQQPDITQEIIKTIKELKTAEGEAGTLQHYPIRTLVQHAQILGPELKRQRLETNQIRKFIRCN